ncbi:hypothetical protein HY772_06415 [Candidatus Woesearchaeota archaeon]|nr:hypothetical protein [Candidatus Woesearchaeota archaeon]
MSYEVYIFFGEQSLENLLDAVNLTEAITGLNFSKAECSEAKFLDIAFEVCPRSSFLKSTEETPYGDFQYQLELSCPVFKGNLIHPIGMNIAQEYSLILKQRSMMCLSGIEFLGAMFKKGQLVIDQMHLYPMLHSSDPWKYFPKNK